jgi:hypothetical protein
MSLCRQIQVICDICGSFCESTASNNADARWYARDDGWRRRKIDGRWLDICFTCLHPGEYETSAPFLCDIGRGDVRTCTMITPKQGDTE